MQFDDSDLRIEGKVSIDQLVIREEDGKIPSYEVTLREDKSVGTIQKIQEKINSIESGNGGAGGGGAAARGGKPGARRRSADETDGCTRTGKCGCKQAAAARR